MRVLRWLLVAPLAFLGYPIGFYLAFGSLRLVDAICGPHEHLGSGVCRESWSSYVQIFVLSFAALVGAVVWVVLAVLVAPAHRAYVAWIAFAFGVAFVVWQFSHFGLQLGVPIGTAIFSGAIAALLAPRLVNAT